MGNYVSLYASGTANIWSGIAIWNGKDRGVSESDIPVVVDAGGICILPVMAVVLMEEYLQISFILIILVRKESGR